MTCELPEHDANGGYEPWEPESPVDEAGKDAVTLGGDNCEDPEDLALNQIWDKVWDMLYDDVDSKLGLLDAFDPDDFQKMVCFMCCGSRFNGIYADDYDVRRFVEGCKKKRNNSRHDQELFDHAMKAASLNIVLCILIKYIHWENRHFEP